MASSPRRYLEEKPTKQSVCFGGTFINLAQLAAGEGLDHGYLSAIFAGKRTPSVDYLLRIATALGMGVEDFLRAVDERRSNDRTAA